MEMAFSLHSNLAMILSMLKIKPLPSKRQQIIDVLKTVQNQAVLIQDCMVSEIYQTTDLSTIFYLEQWRKKEALHRHIESNLFMRVLTVMDLSIEAPEISFPEITAVRAMDLVSALREFPNSEKTI